MAKTPLEINRAWQERNKHPCIDCDKLVHKRASRCPDCAHKARRTVQIRKCGYVFVRKPEHVRANRNGFVREHIIVWEETHGKPLPKGWIVHHLNGIKNDNRPSNLVGFPNRKHYLVLQAKAKRIQELEALLNGQSQLL